MRMVAFSKSLYENMETALNAGDSDTPETLRDLYFIALKAITKLRAYVSEHAFANTKDEINFFKNIKPKFLSTLIYYRKMFDIQSKLPVALPVDVTAYYLNELRNIKGFMESNTELLTYYRSGSSLLDEIYFVRQTPDLWLTLNTEEEFEPDSFNTSYDHKLSKLLAYERVGGFLLEVLKEPNAEEKTGSRNRVTWTASKAGLIELMYALQTSGACNSGTIDVKDMAGHFERLFNVKLGNFYRTFQEIRIRKISRTSFLDQLKENLVKRMDDSDENPRY